MTGKTDTGKIRLVAIGGPTASGKTGLALKIAEKFNGDIVNCDSRQVYRKLDIGTAKEPIEKRNRDGTVMIGGIHHHLIDIVDPKEEYTLADFQKDAHTAIRKISDKGKLPIIAGGTGLYLDAVVYNYDLSYEKRDEKRRERLQKLPVPELQRRLELRDPEILKSMNKSDRNNPHRLIRAIERHDEGRARLITEKPSPYETLYLVLDPPRKETDLRIENRVGEMFEKGLLKENKELREDGYSTELPALKTIGYQEFDEHFSGEQTLEASRQLIVLHTKQYAKRQRTWFRKNADSERIRTTGSALRKVETFLETQGLAIG
jgi:tRNA dimethylallyltransferase